VSLFAVLLSSCTFRSGEQIEVDFLGAKYRFYIYEKPTSQIAVELRSSCQRDVGTERKRWAQCSLNFLNEQVDVPSIANGDWDTFTGADQWDDYGGAVDAIVAGGFSIDASGDRYAHNCLVGDHTGFREYNWTTRAASDSHCKRGRNVGS
jgi:hypothetical protein